MFYIVYVPPPFTVLSALMSEEEATVHTGTNLHAVTSCAQRLHRQLFCSTIADALSKQRGKYITLIISLSRNDRRPCRISLHEPTTYYIDFYYLTYRVM